MNAISPLLRSLHYADASRWSDGQRISPLLRELIDANARARRPEIAQALQAAGMPFEGRPLFGVAPIEPTSDGCYQPMESGHWCLISPAFQDGALVDLAAPSIAEPAAASLTCWAPTGWTWRGTAANRSAFSLTPSNGCSADAPAL